MRAILTACAALAALSLTSCDINTGTPKTAQVDCHCATPPPVAGTPDMRGSTGYEPPPVRHRRRYHGYAYAGHGSYNGHSHYWRREDSELSVATYDYHSDSHSYVMGDSGGAYAEGGGGAYVGGAVHGGWVDGYGPGHGGATA